MGYTNRLMTAKDTLGFKLEAVSGVAETLVAADYGIGAKKITYSPNIGHFLRTLATGDWSKHPSVAGKQEASVTFDCDFTPGGAAGTFITPARWMTAARCCAMNQLFYSAGLRIVTDATQDQLTATIEICKRQEGASPLQHVVKLAGCAGDMEIDCGGIGQPAQIKFTFKGYIASVTTRSFATMLAPTSFDVQVPPAVLSATIQLFSTTQYISKFNLKLNNKVEGFTNPAQGSGFDYFRVVDREPTCELDPDQFVTSDIDLYVREKNDTTGILSIGFGNSMTIYGPVAQIEDAKQGEREGHHIKTVKLSLKRSSGNDEFKISQGVDA
jgi:hypothetical protein